MRPVLHPPVRILFLDQGRASAQAALGHVRARHAFEAGIDDRAADVDAEWASVPPFGRGGMIATRLLPGLGRANLWSLRFVLARSWLARRLMQRRLEHGRHDDVVQITTNQVALLLGRVWSSVPCVLSIDSLYVEWNRMTHGISPEATLPWFLHPIAWLERRALTRSPLTIAWTDKVAADVRRRAPQARVETLHPGIDLNAFRPARRTAAGPVRVLFVGGRWEAKGGPELLEALSPHLGDAVRLDVVTPADIGPPSGVTVHRSAPGSGRMADLFAKADVFCLPTKADACPWVVLEAMASGVPVVATRVGSIEEMVGGGGLIVEPGDAAGLRAALQTLLEDAGKRRALGMAGRARAEAVYDARKNTATLVELLHSVAGDSS